MSNNGAELADQIVELNWHVRKSDAGVEFAGKMVDLNGILDSVAG